MFRRNLRIKSSVPFFGTATFSRRFQVSFLFLLLFVLPTLAAPPQRIVSCMPSITEILFALDLDKQIVGVTTNCNYPPAAKKKEKIGGFFLNLEKIVSLKPDLVILMGEAQKKESEKFRRMELNVLTINPKNVNGVLESIEMIGQVTGRGKSAGRLVGELRKKLKRVENKNKRFKPSFADVIKLWSRGSKKRKALVVVGVNPIIVAGKGTFIDDIISRAGVDNVVKGTMAPYPQYSFEKLVDENPPYIVVPAGLIGKRELKKWETLEAVREKRVLFIDPDILSRPGPRVVEAIDLVSNFIYNGR
ncbi:MAG: helical backbone metal receptor [bacterium]